MAAEIEYHPRVGLVGARFSGARWPHADDPAPPADPPPVASRTEDQVGLTGARFGGARRRRRTPTTPEPVIPEPRPSPESYRDPAPDTDEIPIAGSASAAVRPYILTRGRTRSAVTLSLDTLLSAAAPPVAAVRSELRAALALCAQPRSAAEIAARLGVPLGVAAVLLGDLVGAGLVRVHDQVPATGPDPALLRRVLHGLRRL